MNARRIAYFVDGFNVYHSLKYRYRRYLWLDYRRLAELFTPKKARIERVFYFTAFAWWNPNSVERHRTYVELLQARGVSVVLGKFKTRDRFCPLCKREFLAHEEKQTDVNIAVHLFRSALEDSFDQAFLVTADSDIVPAVRAVRELFPGKQIALLKPIGRHSIELEQTVHRTMRIKQKHLRAAQFPDEVRLPGGRVIKRPAKWR